MTGQPFLCPICSCPLQHLTKNGQAWGTIEDALAEHKRVVHPPETQPA